MFLLIGGHTNTKGVTLDVHHDYDNRMSRSSPTIYQKQVPIYRVRIVAEIE